MTTVEKVLDALGLKPYERFQLTDGRTYYLGETLTLFREDIDGPRVITYLYKRIFSGRQTIIHIPNQETNSGGQA